MGASLHLPHPLLPLLPHVDAPLLLQVGWIFSQSNAERDFIMSSAEIVQVRRWGERGRSSRLGVGGAVCLFHEVTRNCGGKEEVGGGGGRSC